MSEFLEEYANNLDLYDIHSDIILNNRKNSFVDLLTPADGIPKYCPMDLCLSSLSDEHDLPEISTQFSETELFELKLDDCLNNAIANSRQQQPRSIHVQNKPDTQLIGSLTVEQRKIKISKYLEKRKKRTWQKRIYYDCRKKVAENRLRIKGRFVTRTQAQKIFGSES